VAPERRRSANDYEQALRRQQLAAGRGLAQALPADGPAGPRELAAARRVLTQALFELRRLARDLDHELEALQARQKAARRPGEAKGAREAEGPRDRGRAAARPGELDRYEAARNAIDEVIERWEARREQLTTELERRQPRRGGGRKDAGRRDAGRKDAGRVSGRRGGAPARPGPPRSRRSRRSPG
jgi:ribonuclease D